MLKKMRSGFFGRRKSKDTNNSGSKGQGQQTSTLEVPHCAPGFPRVVSISPGSSPVPFFPVVCCAPEKQEIRSTSFLVTPTDTAIVVDPTAYIPPLTVNMSSTPPNAGSSTSLTLSVFVLLPTSSHLHGSGRHIPPLSRPPPLTSRQSGSSLATLGNLKLSPQHPSAEQLGDADQKLDVPDMASANRRLSLAPGIGAGTQTRSARLGDGLRSLARAGESSTGAEQYKSTPPPDSRAYQTTGRSAEVPVPSRQAMPAPTGAPAFGSGSGAGARKAGPRRRPNTATVAESGPFGNPIPRGSMALPSGMGLGIGAGGKNRPGWEGDAVVGVLRSGGMEGEFFTVTDKGGAKRG